MISEWPEKAKEKEGKELKENIIKHSSCSFKLGIHRRADSPLHQPDIPLVAGNYHSTEEFEVER